MPAPKRTLPSLKLSAPALPLLGTLACRRWRPFPSLHTMRGVQSRAPLALLPVYRLSLCPEWGFLSRSLASSLARSLALLRSGAQEGIISAPGRVRSCATCSAESDLPGTSSVAKRFSLARSAPACPDTMARAAPACLGPIFPLLQPERLSHLQPPYYLTWPEHRSQQWCAEYRRGSQRHLHATRSPWTWPGSLPAPPASAATHKRRPPRKAETLNPET